jgi:5-methylcytosine-specific restriction endonuclease McrA
MGDYARKPCKRCGGPKPPGRRRQHCDSCAPLAKRESRRRNHVNDEARHGEKRRAARQAYAEANREKVRAIVSKSQRKRWAEGKVKLDPELERERKRVMEARRRAQRSTDQADAIHHLVVLERDDGVCGICGDDVDPMDFHVDHIVPLARGGPHIYANVQVAHPACNMRKGAAS